MSQQKEIVKVKKRSVPAGTYKKQRGRQPNGDPNRIDIYVGNRLQQRRNELNLTQDNLAVRLGITYQQVQKYERGINRISASRLWDFAQVLGVSVNYFFEGIDADLAQQSPRYLQNGEACGG